MFVQAHQINWKKNLVKRRHHSVSSPWRDTTASCTRSTNLPSITLSSWVCVLSRCSSNRPKKGLAFPSYSFILTARTQQRTYCSSLTYTRRLHEGTKTKKKTKRKKSQHHQPGLLVFRPRSDESFDWGAQMTMFREVSASPVHKEGKNSPRKLRTVCQTSGWTPIPEEVWLHYRGHSGAWAFHIEWGREAASGKQIGNKNYVSRHHLCRKIIQSGKNFSRISLVTFSCGFRE